MIILHLLQLYSVKSQGNAAIVVQIYWMHVRPVRRPWAPLIRMDFSYFRIQPTWPTLSPTVEYLVLASGQ